MPTPTAWSATSDVPLTGTNEIDALIGGTRWTSSTITYSFPNLNSSWSSNWSTGYDYWSGEPWSYYYQGLYTSDMAAVRTALASWSNVANISFVEVADNASTVGDLRFAYSLLSNDAQAWAYFPDNAAYAGDVWFNVSGPYSNYDYEWVLGSYQYSTVIHEIGHALGLKHPFDVEGANSATLPSQLDTISFSIMSYSAAPGNTNTAFSYEPTTPMVLDIAAIQAIYGANYSYNSGNTSYVFSGTGTYHQTIWDGGGIDTITYDSSVGGVIDLREGIEYGSRLGQPVDVWQFDSHGNVTNLGSVNNVWIAYGAQIENAIGGSGNDIITGNDLDNTLNGGAGADTLDGGAGADILIGGTGNDTYVVDNLRDVLIEGADAGTDTVLSGISWTLGANFENLTLTGSAALDGTGNALNNILTGNDGTNRLDGGTGADTLIGGAGNDTYVVDNTGDRVYETIAIGGIIDAGGIDTVLSGIDWTLGSFVENLTLTGSAAINGTGNALNNIFIGNDGNNILDGKAGADILIGGAGDDTYVVDNLRDVLTEEAGAGTDTVLSSVTWTLGANFERLTLIGSAHNGTGNALDNALTGNSHANRLDGGTGADTLIGGAGNDTYVVDNAGDCIQETSTRPREIDTVESSVDWTLGANLERLTLTGSAAINGTGNALANTLTGNDGANRLDGGAGADILLGGAGNDTYVVANKGDRVYETTATIDGYADAGGIDTVESSVTWTLGTNFENLTLTGSAAINGTGNTLDNVLTGNDGNNKLTGGAGADTLIGGLGNDTLIGGAGSDHFLFDVQPGAGNADVISDFIISADVINLDHSAFTGLGGTGALDASAFCLGSSAADSDDRIIYNVPSGALCYDADGVGGQDAVLFATIGTTTHPAISAADFFIV